MSAAAYEQISRLVLELLGDREMTAAEIRAGLDAQLHLPAVLNLMCDQGLLLRVQSGNGRAGRSYRYAVFAGYFRDLDLSLFSEAEAATRLVASYLKSFGPATDTDVAWWTGLGKVRIRQALRRLAGRTAHMSIAGIVGNFIVLRSDLDLLRDVVPADQPTVNLLPALDSYLMGYKLRERYLTPEHYEEVFDRSGNATSTILLNGKVVGVWDFSDNAGFKLFLLEEVSDGVRQQIRDKAQALGRFIAGREVGIQWVSSMIPLTRRTAGGFMSPLRDSWG